jgi:hypothetical protein
MAARSTTITSRTSSIAKRAQVAVLTLGRHGWCSALKGPYAAEASALGMAVGRAVHDTVPLQQSTLPRGRDQDRCPDGIRAIP